MKTVRVCRGKGFSRLGSDHIQSSKSDVRCKFLISPNSSCPFELVFALIQVEERLLWVLHDPETSKINDLEHQWHGPPKQLEGKVGSLGHEQQRSGRYKGPHGKAVSSYPRSVLDYEHSNAKRDQ